MKNFQENSGELFLTGELWFCTVYSYEKGKQGVAMAHRGAYQGPEEDRPLTKRQTAFVAQYLINGNYTEAYQKAGYKAGTYPPDTSRGLAGKLTNAAKAQAAALALRPNIQKAIATAHQEKTELADIRQQITVDYCRGEFLRLYHKNESAGNMSEARQCLENLAKTIGAFKDSALANIDITLQSQYSAEQHAEAKRLANILIAESLECGKTGMKYDDRGCQNKDKDKDKDKENPTDRGNPHPVFSSISDSFYSDSDAEAVISSVLGT